MSEAALIEAIRLSIGDWSYLTPHLQQAISIVEGAWSAPSAVYRPRLMADGDRWCALYGDNLQEGVAGFGDTPWAAMQAFDKAWLTERRPAPRVAAEAA